MQVNQLLLHPVRTSFFFLFTSELWLVRKTNINNLVFAGRMLSKSALVFELRCRAVQTVQTFVDNICKKTKKSSNKQCRPDFGKPK